VRSSSNEHDSTHEFPGFRFDRLSPAGYAGLVLAFAALWLLGRRYAGITHDAILYTVLGLRRLDPGALGNDLFFAHGSQDAYTAFPYLYAPLIDALGTGGAAMALTMAGQIGFVAAAAALVFRMVAGPARWWSLVLLAASSGYYGGVGVFRLAEPFATARTLAEPLVLAALALTLSSRHRTALFALAAAAVLHPLVAAPGAAAVFLWHALARPRMFWSIPVLLGTVLGVIALHPGLLLRFDPPWLAVALERTPHLLISQWLLPDWSRLVWGLCVAWLGARFVEAPVRRLVLSAAAIGLAGVAASWIAVDVLGSATAAALQLWRTHWTMHLIAIALVPVATAALWRAGNASRAAAACLAASCCFGRAGLPAAASLAILAVMLDASRNRWPAWMSAAALRLILLGLLGTAAAGLLSDILSRLPPLYTAARPPVWTTYVYAAGSVGGLLPLAALLWFAAHSRFAFAGACMAAGALVLGFAAWDARAPWPRFIERAAAGENPFRKALPAGAQVFWSGSYGRSWLALGRPTWISVDQGAGVVFNRETALQYAARMHASVDLQASIDRCALVEQPACRIDARPARELCDRHDGPDYLVLNARIEGYPAIEWPLPPEIGPGRQSLFLYDCRDVGGRREYRP
jgi:hypothetical protein